jgi:2-oxoglutarate dehydrogenase E2 component (dihydrolipoamide succinyltransferase)
MIIELKVPESGEEAKILNWLKNAGDNIAAGDKLVEIETAKATVEVEAPESGVLKDIVKQAGDTFSDADVIAIIETV